MWTYKSSDELYHYGVLGMKWGVRRSPTQLSKGNTKKRNSADDIVKSRRKKMSAARRHLSDGDLKAAIERLQNEKKLKDLTNEDVAPGRTAAANIMKQIGKTAITAAGAAVATYAVKAAMQGSFDIKEAAAFIKPKK